MMEVHHQSSRHIDLEILIVREDNAFLLFLNDSFLLSFKIFIIRLMQTMNSDLEEIFHQALVPNNVEYDRWLIV